MAHVSADPHDDSRQVVAKHQGETIGKDEFEFTFADLGVQRVDAGGMHLHQDIVVADRGLGQLAKLANVFVALDEKCLHGCVACGQIKGRAHGVAAVNT
ncbi:hypothetical protein D3C72_1830640 [compost metagenome]